MPLGRLIRRLLCRGNEAVSPVDESSAGIPSGAEARAAVPLGRLQSNPAARPILSPASITLLPSLDGEQFETSVEYQQDHPPTRISRSPEETASLPPTSPHFHGQIEQANINHVGGHYFDNRIAYTLSTPGLARDLGIDVESRRLLDELRKQSSLGAVSYAEARADAGRCHPGTRAKVLNDLEGWSVGEGRWKDVKLLALTGPAGHGKSAIMQTFADRLLERAEASGPRTVAATFFFKTAVPEQDQPKALVTTLAHQVAEHCPSFRRQIVTVLRNNTGIFSISLEHQLKHLLINPITELQDSASSSSLTVVCAADGLDECDGDEAQSRVIRLLYTLSTIPNARVVFASRPEFAVMAAVAQRMPGMLHVDLNKGDVGDDIYEFVWARLIEIRDASRLEIDPLRWPSAEDAWKISDYSSGQFILAATAMRYVGERHHDPRERLKEVLALCGPGANDVTIPTVPSTQPLGPLDTLFTGILVNAGQNADPEDPKEGQLKLSSLVWTLTRILRPGLPLWALEESRGLQRGSIAHNLSDLHSLLEVPEDPYGCHHIRVHHKSFLDFLGDPRRSGHLGNVSRTAEERFDQVIKAHLSSLAVNDLKSLVLTQSVKPHILHHLHLLWKPKAVIESVDPKVWKALLSSLNAYETLVLKAWMSVGLSEGPLWWKFENSKTLRMMDEACKRSLRNSLPLTFENERPADPPPISDTDIELLLVRLDSQGDRISTQENLAFIPTHRTGPASMRVASPFPWFPAARALAWLWAPRRRLVADHSRIIQSTDTPNVHPQEPVCNVFVIGSAGSGKQQLLAKAYDLLPAGLESGPSEGWIPPVDIIIIPDKDGLSLRLLWTPGTFSETFLSTAPCNNVDLMGKIDLSHQIPTSLFQDCITLWKTRHEKNTHYPQFLLQGLHLLSPEHQAMFLDMIAVDARPSPTTGRPPLFITVTSLPTTTLASMLHQFSWPGVYYINLDGLKADVSLLEATLLFWLPNGFPPLKCYKLAQILANSPKPARDLKRLLDHMRYDRDGWETCLHPILAAPESEAWRLIEEHFGDLPSDNEGW